MALALQDANLVWQKVRSTLMSRDPGVQLAFDGLRQYLSRQRRAAADQLEFYFFTEAQCDVAGGTVIVDAAHTLYAVYIKKDTTATDNWFWLYDDATNDGTAADAMVCIPLLAASQEAFTIFPTGFAMGTGGVVTQYGTDPLGAVDGSDGGDGFLIVGRA